VRRGTRTLVAATLVGLLAGGCAHPHDADVGAVASAFYRAYAASEGAAACDRLAPKTKSELEQSAGKACPDAVMEERLPQVSEPFAVEVFGTQAAVKWEGETTFLARFQGEWKVMAAACKPQRGLPYDCTISGG
jgi:hypothetical protein